MVQRCMADYDIHGWLRGPCRRGHLAYCEAMVQRCMADYDIHGWLRGPWQHD